MPHPCGALVLVLPHLCLQKYLLISAALLFFPDCVSFPSHSFSSCWASVHSLCLVWLVPAMAWSWAQGQVWFISTVGHPWVVHSSAQEMVVTQIASGLPWQELCWKPFDTSCQVGMWFGGQRLSLFSGPLSHGAVRGPFSPQPGLEAKISSEGSLLGLP